MIKWIRTSRLSIKNSFSRTSCFHPNTLYPKVNHHHHTFSLTYSFLFFSVTSISDPPCGSRHMVYGALSFALLFRIRVRGFRFRTSGFGLRVSGSGILISGFRRVVCDFIVMTPLHSRVKQLVLVQIIKRDLVLNVFLVLSDFCFMICTRNELLYLVL